MQKGKCSITNEFLNHDNFHCHHITPKHRGGTDDFKNLVIVHTWVHRLIHGIEEQTINKYQKLLQLTKQQIKKLNELRKRCNLTELTK